MSTVKVKLSEVWQPIGRRGIPIVVLELIDPLEETRYAAVEQKTELLSTESRRWKDNDALSRY